MITPKLQKNLDDAVEMLREKLPSLIAIVLFGSYSTEYMTVSSDLDLALLTTSPIDDVKLWDLAQAIASKINRDVDLVDLRKASTVFQYEVFATGRTLFCANEVDFAFFENTAYSMYLYLQEERKEILDDYKSQKE